MSIRIIAAAAALAAGVGLTACSSSSAGTAASTHDLASVAVPPRTSAPATGTSMTSAATSAAVSIAGSGGDFCTQLKGVAPSLQSLSQQGETQRSAYLAKVRQLVAIAPAEIKPDVEVIEQIDEQIVNGNGSADEKFDTPAMAQHMQHFLAWMQSHCPGVLKDVPTTLQTG